MWNVTNPHGVDISAPLVYYIRITSPDNEYRYVGKSSSSGRLLSAYHRNGRRISRRETKRPRIKRNGELQSKGNIEHRWVHLVLAEAEDRGWDIEYYPLCNASKAELKTVEQRHIQAKNCNLNGMPTWAIEDYGRLAAGIA